jgi:hypothetical protein
VLNIAPPGCGALSLLAPELSEGMIEPLWATLAA